MTTRRNFLVGASALAGMSAFGGMPQPAMALHEPEPIQAGYFPVRGGGAWYRMNGVRHFSAGKTPLIVIHGGPGFSHHYLLPIVDLAQDRPVIFYDQLDSGHSDRVNNPDNWTVDRFVSEIDDLRDHLGLHEVIVLGNSWGGTLTAEYAIRRPAGLQAAILSSPLISTPRWISDNKEYRSQLPKEVRQTLDENEPGTDAYQEASMAFYRRHLNRQDPWPPHLNKSFEVLNGELYSTMWGPTEFNATGTLKNYDATDRLSKINVPSLFVCGEYDESTPGANRDFASEVQDSEVQVIQGASHTAFLEKRDRFMTVVRNFIADNVSEA